MLSNYLTCFGRSRKTLATAIITTLLAGSSFTGAYAAPQVNESGTIETGLQIVENVYYGKAVREEWKKSGFYDGNGHYNFNNDLVIRATGSNQSHWDNDKAGNLLVTEMNMVSPIMWNGDKVGSISMNGHKLGLHAFASGQVNSATGIYVPSGDLTIDNPAGMDITASGWGAHGISVVGTKGGGEFKSGKGNAKLTINNDLKAENAVKIRLSDSHAYEALLSNGNSGTANMIIKGLVDVDNTGKPYDAVWAMDGNMEIGGGKIVGADRSAINVGWGGRFTMNADLDRKNNIKDVKSDRDVQIEGDILTFLKGRVAIGLGTADSYFKGAIVENPFGGEQPGFVYQYTPDAEGKVLHLAPFNMTDPFFPGNRDGVTNSGDVHIFMADGAVWDHTTMCGEDVGKDGGVTSVRNGVTTVTPGYNARQSDTSRVRHLVSHNGSIIQNSDRKTVIDKLTGNVNVIYSHENMGESAADYKAGDTHIVSAEEGAAVNVITDNTGINMFNNESVGKALNALAGKVYYDKFVDGEKNLSGKAIIASGLTASAKSLSLADLVFDAKSGQASAGETQNVGLADEMLDTSLQIVENSHYGSAVRDEWKKTDFYDGNGHYNFDRDVTLRAYNGAKTHWDNDKPGNLFVTEMNQVAPIMWNGNKVGSINMNGHDLTLRTAATDVKNSSTGIYVSSGDLTIDNPGKIDIATDNWGSHGISVIGTKGGGEAFSDIKGEAKLVINNDLDPAHAVKVRMSDNHAYEALLADGNSGTANLIIKGLVDVDNTGKPYDAIWAMDGNMELGGGKIIGADRAAIQVGWGGRVTINADLDRNNNIKDVKGDRDVQLEGDIITFMKGRVALGLGTGNSYFKGAISEDVYSSNMPGRSYQYTYDKEGKVLHLAPFNMTDPFFPGNKDGVTNSGDVHISLAKGAVWDHTIMCGENVGKDTVITSESNGEKKVSEGYNTRQTDTSRVRHLVSDGGTIYQNADRKIHLNKLSGDVNIVYTHENDGTKAADFKGGNTTVDTAAADSKVTLITDNSGIDMNNSEAVNKVLGNLANKLYYTESTDGIHNLTGKVSISSGLTASGVSLSMGDIDFDSEGKGVLRNETIVEKKVSAEEAAIEAEYLNPFMHLHAVMPVPADNEESAMMRGARSAATTSALAWRDTMADTYKVADTADEDGIFARTYGGKVEYEGNDLSNQDKYWAAQIGYDKAAGNGWHTGVAFDYRDGDSDYILGGEGDNKLYGFGVYGVKTMDNGADFRLAAKVGRVENDYTVYNEMGKALKGDYKANAFGLTAEYGKKIGSDESYFMPSAQLSFSRVGGKDYVAKSGADSMDISQDAYNSIVGRLALEAGKDSGSKGLFARLGLAHEFSGDIEATYIAADGGKKATSFDGKDTWGEFTVGGHYQISDNGRFQLDFTKDFGGDFHHKWNVNAGLRFSF